MRRMPKYFIVSVVILTVLMAMPALAIDRFGLADRLQEEVTQESVAGKSYNVVTVFSTGGVGKDCYVFTMDGAFFSTRGLEGTWTERGPRWSVDALFGGVEVIEIGGLSFGPAIIGRGESITNDYTFFIVGPEANCAAGSVGEQGNTYEDIAR